MSLKFGALQSRWHHAQLLINLPVEVSSLLEIHLSLGHKVMCCDAGLTDFPYVFMDKKCNHMAQSQAMTQFWHQLLQQLGCSRIFPPHRQAFSGQVMHSQ